MKFSDNYQRFVEYYFPFSSVSTDTVKFCKSSVILSKVNTSIYDAVNMYEKKIFFCIQLEKKKIVRKIKLRSVINLHNEGGIKDIQKIVDMILLLKKGKHLLHSSRLPNIKLVRTIRKELILFDGHHSMLAYMACGKVFLHETPHLFVYRQNGCVRDEDILVFWGSHASKICSKDWKNYVINWQAPINKQLNKRIWKNMGELFDSLSDKIL